VTLSTRLRNVDLTLECEPCGYLLVKKGGWFMTISTFKCQVCKSERRLTYSDKVELFAKHEHLAA
jgi:transposase-like protein